MTVPYLLPVEAGLIWAVDGDSHAASFGVGVQAYPLNQVDLTAANHDTCQALPLAEGEEHYVLVASGGPRYPVGGISGVQVIHIIGDVATEDLRSQTEVLFMRSENLPIEFQSGWIPQSTENIFMNYGGGSRYGNVCLWYDVWRYGGGFGAITAFTPVPEWTMIAAVRDMSTLENTQYRVKQDLAPSFTPWTTAGFIENTYGNKETAVGDPSGAYCLLHYNRALSDAELDQLHAWGVSWLGEQTPSTERVLATKVSTWGTHLQWDEATYGPADITTPDGRIITGAHSPYLDSIPMTGAPPAEQAYYSLTWPLDGLTETPRLDYPPAGGTLFDTNLIELTPTSVTIQMAAPLTVVALVFRDGIMRAIIPPGDVAYTDEGPFVPLTTVRYQIEEFHTEAAPADEWGEVDVLIPTGGTPATIEYWYSEGGAWHRSGSALGSYKGEWVPI